MMGIQITRLGHQSLGSHPASFMELRLEKSKKCVAFADTLNITFPHYVGWLSNLSLELRRFFCPKIVMFGYI